MPSPSFGQPSLSVSFSFAMMSWNVVGHVSPLRNTSFEIGSLRRPATFLWSAPDSSTIVPSHGDAGTSLSGTSSHLPSEQSPPSSVGVAQLASS
jgi:hypothetical protein